MHYGPADGPAWLLIDGGASGVYANWLAPRFAQLREQWEFDDDQAFPLEMVLVSHIDNDHVLGVKDLLEDQLAADEQHQPLPFDIKTLWFNTFNDIVTDNADEIFTDLSKELSEDGAIEASVIRDEDAAVVAGVLDGRSVRDAAKRLAIATNLPFEGMVMQPAPTKVTLAHGLVFTVLGPAESKLKALRRTWDTWLKSTVGKKVLKKEEAATAASVSKPMSDASPANLSSIMVMAEMDGKRMLLTGDARGDHVLDGLVAEGYMEEGGTLHVDLLKMPHHGSFRNLDEDFLKRVTADHYVISADGKHDNPDLATLEALGRARAGTADYTIHTTFPSDPDDLGPDAKFKDKLAIPLAWLNDPPPNCTVVFRDVSGGKHSTLIDLGDPYPEA